MSRENKPTETTDPAILEYRRLMALEGHPVQPDTHKQERQQSERQKAIEQAKQDAYRRAGRFL